ncbi:MAG: glutamine amidotransferase [Planctomycetota bacterium]|jgi:glutamine amidotransferase
MSTTPEILIVATGVANSASVLAAFRRMDTKPRLSNDPNEIRDCSHLVLPGVGAYGPAAQRLDELELRTALQERISSERPTLAICLGMQLLCEGSDESVGTRGLGAVPGIVSPFPEGAPVPQLGWNWVEPAGCELIEAGHAYFANTYRLQDKPDGWSCAQTNYSTPFVSALERGPILACQFHPELSGEWGARLLARWIERGLEVA